MSKIADVKSECSGCRANFTLCSDDKYQRVGFFPFLFFILN